MLSSMKLGTLAPETRTAIHLRAKVLFDLMSEAENNGVTPEMVNHIMIEELEAMKTNLRAICPPERVQALVDELLAFLPDRSSN
jgi:hypothetical protein